MPVNYAPPSPVAFAQSAASRLAGGGGGGGGGGRAFYGPGPIVQLQDRTGEFQNRLNLAAISNAQGMADSDQRFAQASVLARQAAELNAWEFQQRVTTQEAAQERADRNSIAAIDQDPTMTPDEKVQAKTRVRTRVDWVSERAKRDQEVANAQMMQSKAKLFQSEVEQNEAALKFATGQIKGKVQTHVDDDAAIEIGRAIDLIMPGLKQSDPEGFARMVETEAVLQGRATRYAVTEKGVVDLSKGQRFGEGGQLGRSGAGDTGGGADRQGSGSRSGTRGDPVEQAGKDFFEAISKASETFRNSATAPSAEQVMAVAKEFMKGHAEATAGARAQTPEGRSAAAIKHNEGMLASIGVARADLTNSEILGDVGRRYAAQVLSQMETIFKNFPDASKRPLFVQKELDRLDDEVRTLKKTHDAGMAPKPGTADAARNPAGVLGKLFQGPERRQSGTAELTVGQRAVVNDRVKMLKKGWPKETVYNNLTQDQIDAVKQLAGEY